MQESTPRRYGIVPIRRVGLDAFEVLLVRTTARRWIFPKGKAEAGEAGVDAAVRECFEEAGVRGRVLAGPESVHLDALPSEQGREKAQDIDVWFMQVEHEETSSEPEREPTWFLLPAATTALAERRAGHVGEALGRVLDRIADVAQQA